MPVDGTLKSNDVVSAITTCVHTNDMKRVVLLLCEV